MQIHITCKLRNKDPIIYFKNVSNSVCFVFFFNLMKYDTWFYFCSEKPVITIKDFIYINENSMYTNNKTVLYYIQWSQ